WPGRRGGMGGGFAGLVGGGYRWTLGLVYPWHVKLLVDVGDVRFGWILLVVLFASGAALSSWLTVRFAPEAAGSGIPHVEESIANDRRLRWQRLLPVKFVAGALALVSGLSLGREG